MIFAHAGEVHEAATTSSNEHATLYLVLAVVVLAVLARYVIGKPKS